MNRYQRIVLAFLGLLLASSAGAVATLFVTPDYREGEDDEDYAYWLGFDKAYTPGTPPYDGLGWTEVNYPFLGGNDRARIGQHGAPGAIITSNLGIYSFTSDATAFYVYDRPLDSPGTILFQTMTYSGGQTVPDLASVQLFTREAPEDEWHLATLPMSGMVTGTDSLGHFYTAWEWDTSSLSIYDYYISFAYPLPHSSLARAQLDTHSTYQASLDGYSLTINTNVSFGMSFGLIIKSPDKLVYEPGDQVTISITTNSSFAFAKWSGDFGDDYDPSITVVMDDDVELDLILSPRTYYVWRQFAFSEAHGGTNMSAIWAPDVDYDGDGRNNLLEYSLGSDPEVSDVDTYSFRVECVQEGGETYLEALYTRRIGATDLTYALEYSTNLTDWKDNSHPEGPFFAEPQRTAVTDSGVEVVRARLLSPLSSAPSPFLRLNANWTP